MAIVHVCKSGTRLRCRRGFAGDSGLSQSQFALLLGVSVRILQEWEQGRRSPSKAAQTLILAVHLWHAKDAPNKRQEKAHSKVG
ncbi:MAG: helix-turn-helix domain-containing protein [Sulfurisoma sp.]|nr:helix-turn-helix domain-containing protein [Sulfurisoma sp.]